MCKEATEVEKTVNHISIIECQANHLSSAGTSSGVELSGESGLSSPHSKWASPSFIPSLT